MSKLYTICGKRPAALSERNIEGRLVKRVCLAYRATRLQRDLAKILRLREVWHKYLKEGRHD